MTRCKAVIQLDIHSARAREVQGRGAHLNLQRFFEKFRGKVAFCLFRELEVDIEDESDAAAISFLDEVLLKVSSLIKINDDLYCAKRFTKDQIRRRLLANINAAGFSQSIIVNHSIKKDRIDWKETQEKFGDLYVSVFSEFSESDDSSGCIDLLCCLCRIAKHFQMSIPEVLQKKD